MSDEIITSANEEDAVLKKQKSKAKKLFAALAILAAAFAASILLLSAKCLPDESVASLVKVNPRGCSESDFCSVLLAIDDGQWLHVSSGEEGKRAMDFLLGTGRPVFPTKPLRRARLSSLATALAGIQKPKAAPNLALPSGF